MTEWNSSIVRHIPEDELHAYLDQALSRSQCVEIERHLARCPRCQVQRDGIAALRDRTTALLARIGPPPIVPPAFDTLRERLATRTRQRVRWLAAGMWAASLFGALALGWQVSRWFHGAPVAPTQTAHVDRPAPPPEARPPAPSEVSARAPVTHPVSHPAPAPRRERPALPKAAPPAPRQLVRASRPAEDAPGSEFANAIETDPNTFSTAGTFFKPGPTEPISLASTPLDVPDVVARPVGSDFGLQGLWRTIVPDSASQPHQDIPLVPGLPVVQMRVQPGGNQSDVTAVDQMLESGDLIRTIAGPAERVAVLVDEDARVDSTASRRAYTPDRMTVTIRQGDRMVAVTGPSRALGSLLARVNAKPRY